MGAIKVHEFLSADGEFENPAWTAEFGFTEAMGEALAALTDSCSALLLGRTTYAMFAPAWSSRTVDDDPGVPFFNESPKHVVSATMTSAEEWQHSSVLGPYDPQRIRDLKEQTEGDLYVSGSGTLVRAMLADGLVDELHLLVYPIVLGAGGRLFAGMPTTRLSLLHEERFDNGVVHLSYGPPS
jgi:dihydrofolate reductase